MQDIMTEFTYLCNCHCYLSHLCVQLLFDLTYDNDLVYDNNFLFDRVLEPKFVLFFEGILISNFIFVDFDVNYNILVDFDVKIPLHRKMVSASNITLLT